MLILAPKCSWTEDWLKNYGTPIQGNTMKQNQRERERNICILTVMVSSQVYKIVKTHQIIYLNWVQFIVYKVALNKSDQEKKENHGALDMIRYPKYTVNHEKSVEQCVYCVICCGKGVIIIYICLYLHQEILDG